MAMDHNGPFLLRHYLRDRGEVGIGDFLTISETLVVKENFDMNIYENIFEYYRVPQDW